MKGTKDVIKKVLSNQVEEDNDRLMKYELQSSGGQSDAEIPNLNSIEIISDSDSDESESTAVASTKSTKFYAIKSQHESSETDSDDYQFQYYESHLSSPEESPSPVKNKSVLKNATPRVGNKSSPAKPTSTPAVVKQLNASGAGITATTPIASIQPSAIFTHNITPQSSSLNATPTSTGAPKINFVIPKHEYMKCRKNNTPLLLTVPTVPGLAGSNQASTSMIMILPPNLDPSSVSNVVLKPNSTAGPSQINVAGNQTYKMLENTFTIQQLNQAGQPGRVVSKSDTAKSQFVPNILKTNLEKSFEAEKNRLASRQVSGAGAGAGARTNGSQSRFSLPCSSLDLNTKENCGPNFCWYITKNRKRDIEGFQYKDRLGFTKTETNNVAGCLRKINTAIQTKIQQINAITDNLMILNRRKGNSGTYQPSSSTFNDDQIRLQNERLGMFFDRPATDIKPSSSNTNTNDLSDDGYNDLFYTKKVVILKNNTGANRRMKNRTKRMRSLNRPVSKLPMKSKDRGSQASLVKNCRVVLEKDPLVEAKINPALRGARAVDHRIGPARKRFKRSLDDPYAKTYNNNKRLKTYDTRYVSNDSKSTQTEPKSNVRIAYREYQKISKLSHNEIRFIFIINTIHSVENLKINASKPLVILDQSNHHFEFDNVNQYNVIFIRDDGEGIPISLLKNLELVHYIKSGLIQVVNRGVFCSYISSKNNDGNKLKGKLESSATKDKERASSSRAGAGTGVNDKDKFASSLDLLRKSSQKSNNKKNSFEVVNKNIEKKKTEEASSQDAARRPGFKIKIKSKAELNKLPVPAVEVKTVDGSKGKIGKMLQDSTCPAGNEKVAQIKNIEQPKPGSSSSSSSSVSISGLKNVHEVSKSEILSIQTDDGLEEGLLEFLSESNRECVSEVASKKCTDLQQDLEPKAKANEFQKNEATTVDLEEEIASNDNISACNEIVDNFLTEEFTETENPNVMNCEDSTPLQDDVILKPGREDFTPVEDQFSSPRCRNVSPAANNVTEMSAEKSPTREMGGILFNQNDVIQSESCDALRPIEELTNASKVRDPEPNEDVASASPSRERADSSSKAQDPEGMNDTTECNTELMAGSDSCEQMDTTESVENVNLADDLEVTIGKELTGTESESTEQVSTNEELPESSEQPDTAASVEVSDCANKTEVESREEINIAKPAEELTDNSDLPESEYRDRTIAANPVEAIDNFNTNESDLREQTSAEAGLTDISKINEPECSESEGPESSKSIEPESCERMDTTSFDKELNESSSKGTDLELECAERGNAESLIEETRETCEGAGGSSAKPKIFDQENDFSSEPVVESDETLVSDVEDEESLEAKLLKPSAVEGTEPISSDEFDWIQSRADCKEKSDPV